MTSVIRLESYKIVINSNNEVVLLPAAESS